jgi:hypothetical protein
MRRAAGRAHPREFLNSLIIVIFVSTAARFIAHVVGCVSNSRNLVTIHCSI